MLALQSGSMAKDRFEANGSDFNDALVRLMTPELGARSDAGCPVAYDAKLRCPDTR
jgi:hypothetical protein